MRVLLIEDETRLAAVIAKGLGQQGFVADVLGTVAAAGNAVRAVPYDAVILDLGLPDGDGLELLAALRRDGHSLPVLVLTARDAVSDRVRGLEQGADDYLVKPFAMAELLARLKALLRRPGAALGTVLVLADLSLDASTREAAVGGRPLVLGRQELAVLEQLLRRQGRVVPKERLEDKLYGFEHEPASNPIPVHIHHLRQRLRAAGAKVSIHNVRGVGYWIAETDAPDDL